MPIINIATLPVGVDQVLRAQGINPDAVRGKRPQLIELTARSLKVGYPYLRPSAIYEVFDIVDVQHNRIFLSHGQTLEGKLIGEILAPAQKVFIAVCTVGDLIDEYVRALFLEDPALAMAVDGLASAATEVLGNMVCQQIGEMAAEEGLVTSIPINPGMIGWSVKEGQPQLFNCIDTSSIGVELSSAGVMKPLKSLSMAVGAGKMMNAQGSVCDYCNLRRTCTHKPVDNV